MLTGTWRPRSPSVRSGATRRRLPAPCPPTVASSARRDRPRPPRRPPRNAEPATLSEPTGERPEGPFGGLPISEIAIFAGAVGLIVGIIQHGGPALIAGIAVCTLGVLEITGREHFSGYRSHTILLAAMPAVAAEIAFVAIFGEPSPRLLLLAVIVPIYAVLFWLLRMAFMRARQARLARPPAP